MAAHRYWRALSLESYSGADLELSEFQLLAGLVRVDASATLTATVAPTSGALASLQDNNTATGAVWNAAAMKLAPALVWDFGAGGDQDVTNIAVGSAADPAKFLLIVKLQWSDDGTAWTDFATVRGIAWPGVRAKTAEQLVDPFADLVSLLLHGAGADTSTAIADSSDTRKTGTVTGNTQISTAQSMFGGSSIKYDGAGDHLLYAWSSDLHLDGDFTLEAWVYPTATMTAGVTLFNMGGGINIAYPSFQLAGETDNSGNLCFAGSSTNAAVNIGAEAGATARVGAPTLNAWNHVAVTRQGTTFRGFMNGVLGFTFTNALIPYSSGPSRGLQIGGRFDNSWGTVGAGTTLSGYLDEVRVTKGAARYTAAFTPPVAPFALGPGFNFVRGRTGGGSLAVVVPSAASVAIPYGQRRTSELVKGRADYVSGVLGRGIGRIASTVMVDSTPTDLPVVRRVRLYKMRDGALVRELWSKADGTFSFDYIDELERYYVIAFDHNNSFRAVIADNLTPSLIA